MEVPAQEQGQELQRAWVKALVQEGMMELEMVRVLLLAHGGMLVLTAMQTQACVGGEVLANSLKTMTRLVTYCIPSNENTHIAPV